MHVNDTYVGVDNRASSPAPFVFPITAGDQYIRIELLSVKWSEISFLETRAFANLDDAPFAGQIKLMKDGPRQREANKLHVDRPYLTQLYVCHDS